jgi:hypothetical protein
MRSTQATFLILAAGLMTAAARAILASLADFPSQAATSWPPRARRVMDRGSFRERPGDDSAAPVAAGLQFEGRDHQHVDRDAERRTRVNRSPTPPSGRSA